MYTLVLGTLRQLCEVHRILMSSCRLSILFLCNISLWKYIFIYFSVAEDLGYFLSGDVSSSIAMWILVHVFWWIYVCIWVYTGVELVDHKICKSFLLWINSLFPKTIFQSIWINLHFINGVWVFQLLHIFTNSLYIRLYI